MTTKIWDADTLKESEDLIVNLPLSYKSKVNIQYSLHGDRVPVNKVLVDDEVVATGTISAVQELEEIINKLISTMRQYGIGHYYGVEEYMV